MQSRIFLDESGDLGWKFNAPYRNQGSSRYITIAFLLCPNNQQAIPERIVRDFYRKFSFDTKKEIKAVDLGKKHKDFICSEIDEMMIKHPHFVLGAITTRKEGVGVHAREGNTLYNYMMGKAFLQQLHNNNSEYCKITRDQRSVKVANSSIDYLRTITWFHDEKTTALVDNPVDSHSQKGIIFIDWVCNMIWSKYEDNYTEYYDRLAKHLHEGKLFF